jgi:hypothetical protein
MKSKLCSIFFALMFFAGILQSQTLSPSVISSTGGFFTSANAMLSFTVAEMTMVQTFTGTNNILTQGFQQPEDLTVGIPENTTVSTNGMIIYPNPTNGLFTLNYSSNISESNSINIYDLVGQVVLTKTVAQTSGTNIVTFDISGFSQGIYMLELNIVNEKGERKIEFHKINLVY